MREEPFINIGSAEQDAAGWLEVGRKAGLFHPPLERCPLDLEINHDFFAAHVNVIFHGGGIVSERHGFSKDFS